MSALSFVGKTVERIEEEPTDPEYGNRRSDRMLVVFTDGTAIEIVGSSYEEVDLSYSEVSSQQLRRMASAAAGRRETERVQRLRRQEWLSVSCEERQRRRKAKYERMSPMGRMMAQAISDVYGDMRKDFSRSVFGDQPAIRHACALCGEFECENAIPASDPTVVRQRW